MVELKGGLLVNPGMGLVLGLNAAEGHTLWNCWDGPPPIFLSLTLQTLTINPLVSLYYLFITTMPTLQKSHGNRPTPPRS